jgi:hypothetical protein
MSNLAKNRQRDPIGDLGMNAEFFADFAKAAKLFELETPGMRMNLVGKDEAIEVLLDGKPNFYALFMPMTRRTSSLSFWALLRGSQNRPSQNLSPSPRRWSNRPRRHAPKPKGPQQHLERPAQTAFRPRLPVSRHGAQFEHVSNLIHTL